MMRSFRSQWLFIATALIMSSCANQADEPNYSQDSKAKDGETNLKKEELQRAVNATQTLLAATDSTATDKEQEEQSPTPPQKKTGNTAAAAPTENWDRKIIRTADITVEVKDHQAFYAGLRQKVRELGGYIASEEQSQDDYRITNAVVIKVPVVQFDDAMAGLNKDIIAVTQKRVTSQDVTGEMVDTRSRIETKKRVRQRYSELVGNAKNLEEMFTVEREINQIQEDIEAAAGRLTYLGHAAAYSTINFTYYQVINAIAKEQQEPGFGTKLKAAFANGWKWMGGLLLGLIGAWPFLLFLSVAYILLRKMFRRTKANVDMVSLKSEQPPSAV